MAAFGLDTAVTTLGHFGSGRTNIFDIADDDPCSLQILCDNVELLLEYTANLQGLLAIINGRLGKLEKCCEEDDDHWKFLYSAIRDLRRDLLRGKKDWRRPGI